ncbi:hypothetical protein CK203_100658 [Vitis vinifera]|uniref:Uncharacterized protein n=1 Tax=Vitis vinifera TaxID=29760 RepID=A0A438D6A3_VITVI|nr:hypothetical protein CK203_100658 [Vitis vinifera]
MREMLERKIGEEEKRVALGWSKRCSRSGVEEKKGKNSSRYCGEQGRGLILGPSGADECRSLPGQSETSASRKRKLENGKGDGKKMGELIPWCGDVNRAGYYLRLGVIDQEKRRFSIFIPKHWQKGEQAGRKGHGETENG